MLTYIIIAGLLFCTATLFAGRHDNYDDEDTLVTLAALFYSLLWPVIATCAVFWVAGKHLLEAGRTLRRLWEECRRELW